MEKAICPNCGGSAEKEGNEITCEKCDATFKITAKERKQVKTVGRLESIEQRVGRLEQQFSSGSNDDTKLDGDPPADTDTDDDLSDDSDNDDDLIPG